MRAMAAGSAVVGVLVGVMVMFAAMPDTGGALDVPEPAPTPAAPAPAQAPGELSAEPVAWDAATFDGHEPPPVPMPYDGDDVRPGQPRPFGGDPLKRGVDGKQDGVYRADVRGVQTLFVDFTEDLAICLAEQAPPAAVDEPRLMVRVHLVAAEGDASKGRLDKIEVVRDEAGAYNNFLACLTPKLKDAPFEAPRSGRTVVNWSIRR